MPWKNVTHMEEINRFVILAQSDRFTVTELCEQFGISRKTGYKYLERYAAMGLKGLQARSHRPHQFPQRTDEAVEALILAERRLHRTWGPKKLHKVLAVKCYRFFWHRSFSRTGVVGFFGGGPDWRRVLSPDCRAAVVAGNQDGVGTWRWVRRRVAS